MASALFMYGLPQPLIIAEAPGVAQDIVDAARDAGTSAFAELHAQGSYLDVATIDKSRLKSMTTDQIIASAERKDSFTDMRVRWDMVVAVRGVHPGEVPE